MATLGAGGAAFAQTAPAAAPAAPAAPMPMPMTTPAMSATLSANPAPFNVDAGPLGKVYVTGAVTGIGFLRDHQVPGDHSGLLDLTNGQVFIQKTDGPIQFFVQAGAYSLPSLGFGYAKATTITENTYNVVPQAFVKFVPTPEISIQVGKLPTLIGAEYSFTFENFNIDRGLLWNQETAVSRGVQFNYAKGPWTFSASWNDGFYSNKYTWGSALLAYAFDSNNTLAVVGGGSFSDNKASGFATPTANNNGQIYNVIYTHIQGPWTLTPYFQYTYVPAKPALGILNSASTTGVALLAKYTVSPTFNLGGRAEYISSSTDGKVPTNLLYGPNSKAWSLTLTPTYQMGIWFMRGEVSYTEIDKGAIGAMFGAAGDQKSQVRGTIETGFLF